VRAASGRDPSARAAFLVGLAVAFVAAVDLVRWVRPLVLTDSDPAWLVPRLFLGLFVVAATVCAGGLAGAAFLLSARSLASRLSLEPLPLSRLTLFGVAAAAIVLGTLARFACLETAPPSLWIDDVSLVAPALELKGAPSDFADAIRPAPYGVAKPYGSVGVLYLELYRGALLLFGTTVFGVRFLSAAAGVASLFTALALGRAFLPPGGGALAALVLAGLRWNLLLSRWGWNAVVLAPVADVAVLLLLRARRRDSLVLVLAAGAVAGLAAHIYLAAWVVAAALLLLAAWPAAGAGPARPRLRLALLFTVGFACAAAPIFVLKEGRAAPYFARASDHSLFAEIRYTHSAMPAFAAAADSLAAPWFKSDPYPNHDLPGRTRLGWILGLPVALALGRCLVKSREELSGYLLTQGAAALAASIVGGHAGVPNGYRFGYLSDVAAVAAAAGVLCLLAFVQAARRRVAAIAALGLVAVSGCLGARDALAVWPQRPETFDGFHGQDTLIARTALRWEQYGPVGISPTLGHSAITIEGIRRYRLGREPREDLRPSGRLRCFHISPPETLPGPGERLVEHVIDGWGRPWAVVLAARSCPGA
jgi:hypothetical protein